MNVADRGRTPSVEFDRKAALSGPGAMETTFEHEARLRPDTLAIIRPVQCVASPGGSDKVRSSTRRTVSSGSLGFLGSPSRVQHDGTES